jgi:hypothetical protein
MRLHNATPDGMRGIPSVYVGTAESGEMMRLLSEPNAVLREAGLNTAATPSAIIVVPIAEGPVERGWLALIVNDGDVISVISGPHHAQ